jgi:3-oxoacyl-(acyl-carrier-protein) synthase
MTEEPVGGRVFFSNVRRSLEEEDEIRLVSVGVDIGSSTSHLVFSRLVLERLDSAVERGARIHGIIRGVGTTADAFDIVAPRPHGRKALKAIQLALNDADVDVGQLQLVKAHATGTQVGDLAEAHCLAQLWNYSLENRPADGGRRPWLIAPKAALGHLISASAPVECILTLAALNDGRIPGQLNCDQPEPILPFALPSKAQPLLQVAKHPPLALVNSFGFGGKNVSLVLEGVAGPATSP